MFNLSSNMEQQKIRGHRHQQQKQLSRRRSVVRKWLNIATSNSDFSADSDSDSGSDQEFCDVPKESRFKNEKLDLDELKFDADEPNMDLNSELPDTEAVPRLRRRRKSETFRAQYINSKEIRICAATWNVGGIVPPDDLDLDGWLDTDEPADVYVIGFQEIVPLSAGNVLGAEDSRPVPKWENIIRETLNRVPPVTKFKSYSDPPSPSKFKPPEDAVDIEDEVVLESDSDFEERIYSVDEETCDFNQVQVKDGSVAPPDMVGTDASLSEESADFDKKAEEKRLHRLHCLRRNDSVENVQESNDHYTRTISHALSGTDRIGLSWPEPPLDIFGQHMLDRPNSFGSSKSFRTFRSYRTYGSFKSNTTNEDVMRSNIKALVETDLESLIKRKRRPPYVRIVSKQMVGVFITIWVRRSLRRYIQNLNVSAVGVGVMGYIGNKGAVSVSMSIHQTVFCFICTHLTAGERDADAVKRNADVHDIHRRTVFNYNSAMGLPKSIYDHEKIIWLGDLNYRINLPYDHTLELISKKDWSKLLEHDQLTREFKKGRAFDGWSEGTLSFAPTYKYELNSDTYFGEDSKAGRRTPAWCDRVLSFGTGMRLLDYRRDESKLSDHRPVTASYMVEVEVFSHKKLQRALTFTTAEIEEHGFVTDVGLDDVLRMPVLEEDESYWER